MFGVLLQVGLVVVEWLCYVVELLVVFNMGSFYGVVMVSVGVVSVVVGEKLLDVLFVIVDSVLYEVK